MSKSVLVIETPTQAYECPFDDRGYCEVKRDICVFWEGIKCPLKPMPEKKPVSYHDDLFGDVEKNYTSIGWNACLDELEGKE